MFKKNQDEIIALLSKMNIDSDCVIVNQCNKNNFEYIKYKNHRITIIYSDTRGLSKSRNIALQNAKADIVSIADDDMRYIDGYSEIILNAHITYSDDIITFQVNDDKKYPKNEKRITRFKCHANSVELTMKLDSIKNINISFNELFGSGSEYFHHGEEKIFYNDCLLKNKHIKYIPLKIASLIKGDRPSTWFTGYNKKLFMDKGALYYELYKYFGLFYIIQFAIRKHGKYKENISLFKAVYYMLYGMSYYKNIKRNQNKLI